MSFIVSIDGADLSGKTTLITSLQDKLGFARLPKIIEIGRLPRELNERLHWYATAPCDDIVREVLLSDMERRIRIDERPALVDRGRITVLATCIAQLTTKRGFDFQKAISFTESISLSCHYTPQEDCSFYLQTTPEQIPVLEGRQVQREGKIFTDYERAYILNLITALEYFAGHNEHITFDSLLPHSKIRNSVIQEVRKQWNQ